MITPSLHTLISIRINSRYIRCCWNDCSIKQSTCCPSSLSFSNVWYHHLNCDCEHELFTNLSHRPLGYPISYPLVHSLTYFRYITMMYPTMRQTMKPMSTMMGTMIPIHTTMTKTMIQTPTIIHKTMTITINFNNESLSSQYSSISLISPVSARHCCSCMFLISCLHTKMTACIPYQNLLKPGKLLRCLSKNKGICISIYSLWTQITSLNLNANIMKIIAQLCTMTLLTVGFRTYFAIQMWMMQYHVFTRNPGLLWKCYSFCKNPES